MKMRAKYLHIMISIIVCSCNKSDYIPNYNFSDIESCLPSVSNSFELISIDHNIIPYSEPWEGYKLNYVSVAKFEDIYYLWYEAFESFEDDLSSTICFATSTDGEHWIKPKSSKYLYNGSSSNIIYDGKFTKGAHAPFVYIDTLSNKGAIFKMIFVGGKEYSLFGAESNDGVNWSQPFLLARGGGRDSQNSFYYDKKEGVFKYFLRGTDKGVRQVDLFFSSEFKENALIFSSEIAVDNSCINDVSQVYTPTLSSLGTSIFGFPSIFNTEFDLCYPVLSVFDQNSNSMELYWVNDLIAEFDGHYKQVYFSPNILQVEDGMIEMFYQASTSYHGNIYTGPVYKSGEIGKIKFKIDAIR